MPSPELEANMRRREFLGVLGGAAAAWPLVARAQQGERVRRIGILMPFPPTNAEMQARVRVFREELRKSGWAAGVNVQFDERWTSDNMDLIRSAATNLVELNPDAIMAVGARVIPILMELTRSIPIVTPSGADPVAYGLRGKPRSSRPQRDWLFPPGTFGRRQDAADAERDRARRFTHFHDL